MTKKETQAYTEEFRKEAVRRAEQKGNTAASVGRSTFGVNHGYR